MIVSSWMILSEPKHTYRVRRQKGPSNTAVTPSIETTPESRAAYLESPLLYSFPAIFHFKAITLLQSQRKDSDLNNRLS